VDEKVHDSQRRHEYPVGMNKRIAEVSDSASLAAFVESLRGDEALAVPTTMDDYLEQMKAFIEDPKVATWIATKSFPRSRGS
jgi:hypothetical protein